MLKIFVIFALYVISFFFFNSEVIHNWDIRYAQAREFPTPVALSPCPSARKGHENDFLFSCWGVLSLLKI